MGYMYFVTIIGNKKKNKEDTEYFSVIKPHPIKSPAKLVVNFSKLDIFKNVQF
jgi:hypothetical protein